MAPCHKDLGRCERRDRTVSVVASLLMSFFAENRQVELWINSQPIPPKGAMPLDYLLSVLALFDHEGESLIKRDQVRHHTDESLVIAIREDAIDQLGIEFDQPKPNTQTMSTEIS